METISTSNAIKAVVAALNQTAPAANQFVMIFSADGTPIGKYPARQLIQDMATAGTGFGTCSTAATTAAKTVAISDFILLKGGIISVFFTTAIDVADATLNVNSTGAKNIKVMGANIQPGMVKARTVVQLQYDGSAWNVVSMFGLEQGASPSDLYVDMGLPSGLKWATRSIDLTQNNKFAASAFQYECTFFSWGNTDGYNPISTSAFDHNWGGVNEEEPWYEDQPYGSTPGAALTANIAPSMDAARANLGGPWRMPTTAEFKELFDNCDYINADGEVIAAATTDKRVTVNDVLGLYLKSKNNGNRIFFACSGYGSGSSWYSRGSNGYYWSASFGSARYARYLYFYSGGVNPQNGNHRCLGFAVRPVQ